MGRVENITIQREEENVGTRWALNFETDILQQSDQLGKHGGNKLRKDPIRKYYEETKSCPPI